MGLLPCCSLLIKMMPRRIWHLDLLRPWRRSILRSCTLTVYTLSEASLE
jgi:hypothetical protein